MDYCGGFAVFFLFFIAQVSGDCTVADRRALTELPATQDVQHLYSPGWRVAYYSNMYCKWLINGSDIDPGFRVIIDVTYLSIENSPGCSYDGLAIHDGSSETATPLGRICNLMPTGQMFKMTGPYAFLVQRSDSSVQRTGFSLRYFKYKTDAPTTACTSTVTLTASISVQYLTSPDFPTQLDVSSTCTWMVSATIPSRILTITVVYLDSAAEDLLRIYDGADSSAEQLTALSTDRTTFTGGSVFTTTSDKAYIQYTTVPVDIPRSGFIVSYNESSTVDTTTEAATTAAVTTAAATVTAGSTVVATTPAVVTMPPVPATTTVTVTSNCGSSVMTPSLGQINFITTPGYPEFYEHNLSCVWLIQAATGDQIVLDVIDSSMEDSEDCVGDHVSIYDGPTTSYPLLASFCGTRYQSVISTGSSILITFTSDGSASDRGFRFMYYVSAQDTPTCADKNKNVIDLNATTSVQYFTSANYPGNYDSNAAQYWLIHNPSGSGVIKITVEDSRIEASYPCIHDKVTVYKGPCESYPKLGTFCGEEKPVYYQNTGSYVYVAFISDSKDNNRGFNVSYIVVEGVPSGGNTYVIVGIVVGSILGALALIVLVFAVYKGVKKYTAGKSYKTRSKAPADSEDEEERSHTETPLRKPTKGTRQLDNLLAQ